MESRLVLKTALRHDTIRRAIEVTGRASSADLKDRLGVTEMTILEDLKHLESKGLLKRMRGRAVASRGGTMELPLEETNATNHAEKKAIGACASSMVPNDQTVIIDVGSTTTVNDVSGADLLITDDGADASVLSNLEGDGLAIEVVRPNANRAREGESVAEGEIRSATCGGTRWWFEENG